MTLLLTPEYHVMLPARPATDQTQINVSPVLIRTLLLLPARALVLAMTDGTALILLAMEAQWNVQRDTFPAPPALVETMPIEHHAVTLMLQFLLLATLVHVMMDGITFPR